MMATQLLPDESKASNFKRSVALEGATRLIPLILSIFLGLQILFLGEKYEGTK